MVMMVGSHIPLPSLKPVPPQILSTTSETEGVSLGPEWLKELKTLAAEWDKQSSRAIADEAWHGLLDYS